MMVRSFLAALLLCFARSCWAWSPLRTPAVTGTTTRSNRNNKQKNFEKAIESIREYSHEAFASMKEHAAPFVATGLLTASLLGTNSAAFAAAEATIEQPPTATTSQKITVDVDTRKLLLEDSHGGHFNAAAFSNFALADAAVAAPPASNTATAKITIDVDTKKLLKSIEDNKGDFNAAFVSVLKTVDKDKIKLPEGPEGEAVKKALAAAVAAKPAPAAKAPEAPKAAPAPAAPKPAVTTPPPAAKAPPPAAPKAAAPAAPKPAVTTTTTTTTPAAKAPPPAAPKAAAPATPKADAPKAAAPAAPKAAASAAPKAAAPAAPKTAAPAAPKAAAPKTAAPAASKPPAAKGTGVLKPKTGSVAPKAGGISGAAVGALGVGGLGAAAFVGLGLTQDEERRRTIPLNFPNTLRDQVRSAVGLRRVSTRRTGPTVWPAIKRDKRSQRRGAGYARAPPRKNGDSSISRATPLVSNIDPRTRTAPKASRRPAPMNRPATAPINRPGYTSTAPMNRAGAAATAPMNRPGPTGTVPMNTRRPRPTLSNGSPLSRATPPGSLRAPSRMTTGTESMNSVAVRNQDSMFDEFQPVSLPIPGGRNRQTSQGAPNVLSQLRDMGARTAQSINMSENREASRGEPNRRPPPVRDMGARAPQAIFPRQQGGQATMGRRTQQAPPIINPTDLPGGIAAGSMSGTYYNGAQYDPNIRAPRGNTRYYDDGAQYDPNIRAPPRYSRNGADRAGRYQQGPPPIINPTDLPGGIAPGSLMPGAYFYDTYQYDPNIRRRPPANNGMSRAQQRRSGPARRGARPEDERGYNTGSSYLDAWRNMPPSQEATKYVGSEWDEWNEWDDPRRRR